MSRAVDAISATGDDRDVALNQPGRKSAATCAATYKDEIAAIDAELAAAVRTSPTAQLLASGQELRKRWAQLSPAIRKPRGARHAGVQSGLHRHQVAVMIGAIIGAIIGARLGRKAGERLGVALEIEVARRVADERERQTRQNAEAPTHPRKRGQGMQDLIAEAARMPDAAVRFASTTEWVNPPREFASLLETVRTKHKAQQDAVNAALDQRFNQPAAVWMGCFRAAAEMALMAEVGAAELRPGDRRRLRELWDHLLGMT